MTLKVSLYFIFHKMWLNLFLDILKCCKEIEKDKINGVIQIHSSSYFQLYHHHINTEKLASVNTFANRRSELSFYKLIQKKKDISRRGRSCEGFVDIFGWLILPFQLKDSQFPFLLEYKFAQKVKSFLRFLSKCFSIYTE